MTFSRLLFALTLSATCVSTAFSADTQAPFWQKTCDQNAGGKPCWIEQFAVAMPNRAVVLRLRFARQDDTQTRMTATAPLGVLLPPGLKIVLNGAPPLTVPFERCTAEGCDAVAVLDQSAMDKLVKGKSLVLHYDASAKASADIPIRLEGLASALRSLSP